MRILTISTISLAVALTLPAAAQQQELRPTDELRTTVREWVETMRKIQEEENQWARDQEVLTNYKEGLQTEIKTLTEQIEEARIRRQGVDGDTADKEKERDLLIAAQEELTKHVLALEADLVAKLPLFPKPLRDTPKVSQAIEELQMALALPEDKRAENLGKRLMNVINLVSEAEKFQQTVHLREELHRDAQGREYQIQIVYFGLSCAYGVNADDSFAVVGRPGADGWSFEEDSTLASRIRTMISAITGDQDATFVNLPLPKR